MDGGDIDDWFGVFVVWWGVFVCGYDWCVCGFGVSVKWFRNVCWCGVVRGRVFIGGWFCGVWRRRVDWVCCDGFVWIWCVVWWYEKIVLSVVGGICCFVVFVISVIV